MDSREFDPVRIGEKTPVEGGIYNRGHHFRAAYGDDYVYIKEVDPDSSEFDTDRSGLSIDEAYSNVAAGIVLDDLDVNVPHMLYDEESELLVVEEVCFDAQPIGHVDPYELYLDEFDTERYVDAAVSKLLVGDEDIQDNILVDITGEFYVIDFDRACERRLEDESYTYDELVGNIQFWAENDINRTVEEKTIRERAERLADQLDVDAAIGELERLDEFRGKGTLVQNLEWFDRTFNR